jgi:hypothetical protein
MSNRFSAKLKITAILDVNAPYAVEAQFDDNRVYTPKAVLLLVWLYLIRKAPDTWWTLLSV